MPYQRASSSCPPHHFFKSSANCICLQTTCSLSAIPPKVWTCTSPRNKPTNTPRDILEIVVWLTMRGLFPTTYQDHARGCTMGRDKLTTIQNIEHNNQKGNLGGYLSRMSKPDMRHIICWWEESNLPIWLSLLF